MKTRQHILSLERYGNQNSLRSLLISIKGLRQTDRHTENLLKERGLKPYIPKLNKFKVGLLILLTIGCLLTPCTNWLIIPLSMWGLK